jgi:hypothetical protein
MTSLAYAPVLNLWAGTNKMDRLGLEAISSLLATNTVLELLDLKNSDIDDAEIAILSRGLAKNTTLKKLYLKGNLLTFY